MSLKLALCLIVLVACVQGADLSATVARGQINVGETTVVSLSGGQTDVAGGHILDNFGSEFAKAVEISKLDKHRFQVKGLAACDCVLKFSDGKNQTTVRLKIVKK